MERVYSYNPGARTVTQVKKKKKDANEDKTGTSPTLHEDLDVVGMRKVVGLDVGVVGRIGGSQADHTSRLWVKQHRPQAEPFAVHHVIKQVFEHLKYTTSNRPHANSQCPNNIINNQILKNQPQ